MNIAESSTSLSIKIDGSKAELGAGKVRKSLNSMKSSAKQSTNAVDLLKRTLLLLGVSITAGKVLSYAESWAVASNKLRVYITDQKELVRVQDTLYKISNKNRVSFDGTASLFNKLLISQKQLGLQTSELTHFTDLVGKTLAISGTNAQQARGALLQLGQAMSTGRVYAEEFNSIVEGTPRLALAIAEGVKEANGDVGTLKTLVKEGAISSRDLFQAIMSQYPKIVKEFGNITPVISTAFVVFENALIRTFGELDASLGISVAFSNSLVFLADNMKMVFRAVGVTTGAFALFYAGLKLEPIVKYVFALTAITAKTDKINKVKALMYVTIMKINKATALMNVIAAKHPYLIILAALTMVVSYLIIFKDQIRLSADSVYTLGDHFTATFRLIKSKILTVIDTIGFLTKKLKDGLKAFNDFTRGTSKEPKIVRRKGIVYQQGIVGDKSDLIEPSMPSEYEKYLKQARKDRKEKNPDKKPAAPLKKYGRIDKGSGFRDGGNTSYESVSGKLDHDIKSFQIHKKEREISNKMYSVENSLKKKGKSLTEDQNDSLRFKLTLLQRLTDEENGAATYNNIIEKEQKSLDLLKLSVKERQKRVFLMDIESSLEQENEKITDDQRQRLLVLQQQKDLYIARNDLNEHYKDSQTVLNEKLTLYNDLRSQSIINEDSYNKAVKGALASNELIIDSWLSWQAHIESVSKQWSDKMADAFVRLAQTGKLSFKDMANSIIADIVRMSARAAIVRPFMIGMSNMTGMNLGGQQQGSSAFNTKASTGSPIGFESSLTVGARASGGSVTAGRPTLVGERGAELYVPSQDGSIVPNKSLNSSVKVKMPKINFTVNNMAPNTEVDHVVQENTSGGIDFIAIIKESIASEFEAGEGSVYDSVKNSLKV